MSLIRVRRDRKRDWIDTKKGRSTRTLLFLLAVVIAAIIYITMNF